MPNLHKNIVEPLEDCLGRELSEVRYYCFGEPDKAKFNDPDFHFVGEVQLFFVGEKNLMFNWEQNSPDDDFLFSLVVTQSSQYTEEQYTEEEYEKFGYPRSWSVADFRPWSDAIGKRLGEVKVYGELANPIIAELSFDSGIDIFVGLGHQTEFGFGDDMLVRSSENMIDLTEAELIWSGLTH